MSSTQTWPVQYAYGAQSVKCAVCNHVTPTDPTSHNLNRQGSAPTNAPPKPPTQTVVVENPATLDEHGNEVSSNPPLLCLCAVSAVRHLPPQIAPGSD